MARPHKNNADYFSHDADMRNDLRIKALRRRYQHEGYAIYNMLLEVLTDSDYFEYELSEINFELLAGDFDIDIDRLHLIVNYLVNIDLFQVIDNILKCKTLDNRLNNVLSKRKRDRKVVIDDENTQSKVNESKGNEIKAEESKVNGGIVFTDLDELKMELLNSHTWIDAVSINSQLTVEQTRVKILDFIKHLKAGGETDKSFSNYQSYFRNWVLKNKDNKKDEPEGMTMRDYAFM